MPDHVQPGAFLIFRIRDIPGRLLGVGYREHLVLGPRVLGPVLARLQIHRAQLPALGGAFHAPLKALLLFLVADGEPVFDQSNPGAD